MLIGMQKTGQFSLVLPQFRSNYFAYANTNSSEICGDELQYSDFQVNFLQLIGTADEYPFSEADREFVANLCSGDNRPSWMGHQERQIFRYLDARSSDTERRSASLRAAVEELLASRSAPEGRSVVRSTANSTSTVYIIGTDKIAYEIAENSKFITDSNVLDELARTILQDVSEGPVVRNYSTYAVQALADICAVGCSVEVISEIDPFVMDIMELGSSDERWDTTDIAEAWANMISGQPADTLRSETLPRLLALAQDPDKAGLQMRATTRAFALALEQLARTDHSKKS